MTTPLIADWKSDGSNDPSLGDKQMTYTVEALEDGTKCLDVKTTKTLPSNFLYELPTPATRFFLDVAVEEMTRGSSLSVGVAKLSNFKKGFGTKGMFYNGNLTNGMSALKISYGHRPQKGDSVIVEYVVSEEFIDVTYYVNNELVGTGFRVPKDEEAFYPEMSMTGEVKVHVKVTADMPPCITSDEGANSPSIMRTAYTLTEAKDSSGNTIIPVEGGDPNKKIKVTVNPTTEEHAGVTVVVYNVMSIGKKFAANKGGGIALAAIEGGNNLVASTRRMPPAPYVEVENMIAQCLTTEWASMELSADGKELRILNRNSECMAKGEKEVRQRGQPALTSY